MSTVLHGTTQNDGLTVAADNTQVYGLAGNDTLTSANHGGVLLIGGSGDDLIQLSGGKGTLSGGAGKDTFAFYYSAAASVSAVIEDVDYADDKIIVTGSTAPQLAIADNGNDLIVSSGDGLFSVTLKGTRESKNYFDGTAPDGVWDVLELTNDERESQNLTPLTLNQDLTSGSSVRAQEIIKTFGHTRPDGSSCFTVLNGQYSSTGENIAAGQTSSSDVVTAWMNSSGHRANILNSGFTQLGVGYAQDSLGTYGNYWVQMFGGTSTDSITVTPNEMSRVPITSTTGNLLVPATIVADPNDSSTWPSDWMTNPNVYTGGNQVISNYASGNKIYFGADFANATFDGVGNLLLGSSFGVLTVQNIWNKIVDVSNMAGQTFLAAYESYLPGVIDGRGFSSRELIAGSRYGGDVIFAGDGGSSLWGGSDVAADVLVGGNGTDVFVSGKSEGSDSFVDASAFDTVYLRDVTVSDISLTASDGNSVGILFNTGNVLTVTGTSAASADFVLADGSTYWYGFNSKQWYQTA